MGHLHHNGLHINCLKLGAVTLALVSFRHQIPAGSVIRLRRDSMVDLGVMGAGPVRSPVLIREMWALYEVFCEMEVELGV